MNPCPSCNHPIESSPAECPYCGLIFEKWHNRQAQAAKPSIQAIQYPAGVAQRAVHPVLAVALLGGLLAGIGWYAKNRLYPPQKVEPPPPPLEFPWPPVVGQPYPDLKLLDHTGETVSLSSFKGKVIIVEPIGMTCSACQAFSGAHSKGSLGGIQPQADLKSFEEALSQHAGVGLGDSRLVFVQLILYNMSMQAPSAEDAHRWAGHFGLDGRPNCMVLAADRRMLGDASYQMVPGFHLIDQNFNFVANSTKYQRTHDLWREFLPLVGQLVSR